MRLHADRGRGVEIACARLHGAAGARFLDGESVVLTGGCTWTAD